MILAVCLTGCSTFFEDLGPSNLPSSLGELFPPLDPAEWAKHAEAKSQAKRQAAPEAQAQQLPPALELCLKRSLRQKAKKAKAAQGSSPTPDTSADQLVIAKLDAERQREVCAYQILKWHEDQRKPKAAPKK
jgi:hypothetical protein